MNIADVAQHVHALENKVKEQDAIYREIMQTNARLRDEIERLREEVAEWRQAASAEASERRKSHDEITNLREALSKIIDATFYENTRKIRELAHHALQQNRSE